MINREIIRIKIVQLTYAYYQNGNKNIDSAEKELFFSLSKAYDLYNYLLSLIVSITKEARKHLEVAQAKARREGEKRTVAEVRLQQVCNTAGRKQDAQRLHGDAEKVVGQ